MRESERLKTFSAGGEILTERTVSFCVLEKLLEKEVVHMVMSGAESYGM